MSQSARESAVLIDDQLAAVVDLCGRCVVVPDSLAHHRMHVVASPVEPLTIAPEVVVLIDHSSMHAGVLRLRSGWGGSTTTNRTGEDCLVLDVLPLAPDTRAGKDRI